MIEDQIVVSNPSAALSVECFRFCIFIAAESGSKLLHSKFSPAFITA
jgi:hypothetical protein